MKQLAMLGKKSKTASTVSYTAPIRPPEMEYLWRWFHEILQGLPVNGMVHSTLSWDVLATWSTLMRVPLEPWEARVLVQLGALRASILSEKSMTKMDS